MGKLNLNSNGVIGVLVAGSALVFAGCGTYVNPPLNKNLQTSVTTQAARQSAATGSVASTTASGATSTGDWVCEDTQNIAPRFDAMYDGSGYYSSCTITGNKNKIQLHGKTAVSNTLCVFPAQRVGMGQQPLALLDANKVPYYQCKKVDGGPEYEFTSLQFNAVFVIEAPLKDALVTCMMKNQGGRAGDYSMCPNFSFGDVTWK